MADCFGTTGLKSGNLCPLCAKGSLLSPLGLMQLNLEEAIWICSHDKCPFPFTCGPVSNFIISRNFMDMPRKPSKRKPKKKLFSTSSVTNMSNSLSVVEPSNSTVGTETLPIDQVSVSATSGFCSETEAVDIDVSPPSFDAGACGKSVAPWSSSVRDEESAVKRNDRNLAQLPENAQTFVSGSVSSSSCASFSSSAPKFPQKSETPEIPSSLSVTEDTSHMVSTSLPLLCVDSPRVTSVLLYLKTCSESLDSYMDGLGVAEQESLLTMKCHWKTECSACSDFMESESAHLQTLTIRTCGQDFSPSNPAVINTCVSCAGIGSSRVIWDEKLPPVVTYSFLSGTGACPAPRLFVFRHARHVYEARLLVCMSRDHIQRLWIRGRHGKWLHYRNGKADPSLSSDDVWPSVDSSEIRLIVWFSSSRLEEVLESTAAGRGEVKRGSESPEKISCGKEKVGVTLRTVRQRVGCSGKEGKVKNVVEHRHMAKTSDMDCVVLDDEGFVESSGVLAAKPVCDTLRSPASDRSESLGEAAMGSGVERIRQAVSTGRGEYTRPYVVSLLKHRENDSNTSAPLNGDSLFRAETPEGCSGASAQPVRKSPPQLQHSSSHRSLLGQVTRWAGTQSASPVNSSSAAAAPVKSSSAAAAPVNSSSAAAAPVKSSAASVAAGTVSRARGSAQRLVFETAAGRTNGVSASAISVKSSFADGVTASTVSKAQGSVSEPAGGRRKDVPVSVSCGDSNESTKSRSLVTGAAGSNFWESKVARTSGALKDSSNRGRKDGVVNGLSWKSRCRDVTVSDCQSYTSGKNSIGKFDLIEGETRSRSRQVLDMIRAKQTASKNSKRKQDSLLGNKVKKLKFADDIESSTSCLVSQTPPADEFKGFGNGVGSIECLMDESKGVDNGLGSIECLMDDALVGGLETFDVESFLSDMDSEREVANVLSVGAGGVEDLELCGLLSDIFPD